MAKLKKDTLKKENILDFLEIESSFQFEIKVLNTLNDFFNKDRVFKNYKQNHGGIYIDPITNKPREFDIRVEADFTTDTIDEYRGINRNIKLAVECTNLKDYNPLVFHSTRREYFEKFHYLIAQKKWNASLSHRIRHDNIKSVVWCKKIKGKYSPYANDFVGKSSCILGINEDQKDKNKRFSTNDAAFYSKLMQSLNSAEQFIEIPQYLDTTAIKDSFMAIIPIVVVPNNCLWDVQYKDYKGKEKIVGEPINTDHIQYLYNKEFYINYCSNETFKPEYSQHKVPFAFSHVDIVTLKGLTELLKKYFNKDDDEMSIFKGQDLLK